MTSRFAAIGLAIAAVLHASAAQGQQNTFTPAALPNSVERAAPPNSLMLVIPEQQIFADVDLTPAQRSALSKNLRSAGFGVAAQQSFTPQNIASQRLPSGEALKTLQQTTSTPGGMWLTDPCAMSDVTAEQLAAVRKLIELQLKARNGDAAAFARNIPGQCARNELRYYMRAALAVAP